MYLVLAALTVVFALIWIVKRHPTSLGSEILSLARSMDVTHLHSRPMAGSKTGSNAALQRNSAESN
jgi:hypothetical protein